MAEEALCHHGRVISCLECVAEQRAASQPSGNPGEVELSGNAPPAVQRVLVGAYGSAVAASSGAEQPRQGAADGREAWALEWGKDGRQFFRTEAAAITSAGPEARIVRYVPADQVSRSAWVPVSERLPNYEAEVLIHFRLAPGDERIAKGGAR